MTPDPSGATIRSRISVFIVLRSMGILVAIVGSHLLLDSDSSLIIMVLGRDINI